MRSQGYTTIVLKRYKKFIKISIKGSLPYAGAFFVCMITKENDFKNKDFSFFLISLSSYKRQY